MYGGAMNVFSRIKELFARVEALPEGIYHMQAVAQDEKPFRLHLRLQKGGTGILILNASTVLQLNPTAAEYAFHMIQGAEAREAAKAIAGRYRITQAQALDDYNDFVERIQNLRDRTDLDPVSVLDFEQAQPNSADLTAPLRLDCALTYRLPDGADPLNAPIKRVDRELTTSEWQTVIDKAWAAGIPHIVFTGGEATLREDLPALIAHAEKNGQVTGLLTDGARLVDGAYLELLLQTGLDHLMIVLPTQAEPNWQSIQNVLVADIFLAIHMTITPENVSGARAMMDKLREAGVEAMSLSVSDPALHEQVSYLRDHAADINLRLIADLPAPYSSAHPVAIETADDSEPAGAGKAWLYVEPDGDVLPAQGMADRILGNILREAWEKIY
jgi:hypothetical protein